MAETRNGVWLSAGVSTVLSATAAANVLFWISLALGKADTEPLESPLVLSVARQLIRGPWELYGPFDGQNPLVIIHAPLFYRVAALAAWPLVVAGFDPVSASLCAGRALSFLGLACTMAAAFRIARSAGAPAAAGWWAALLIAGSLVPGAMPYSVRPDMLGVALQTCGVFLVLTVLATDRPGRAALPAAYAAFGLAVCVKQHFIVTAVVSTGLLLVACARGRLSIKLVIQGLLAGMAVVLVVYGTEELASGGRMSQAVFYAAASARQVHPGNWMRASIIVREIIDKSSGPIAMFLAAGSTIVATRGGFSRRALVAAGTGVIALVAARTILDLLQIELSLADSVNVAVRFIVPQLLMIAGCCVVGASLRPSGRLEFVLCIYLAGEVASLLFLSQTSTGAWVNYGIQAIVFASVLVARVLARSCAGNTSLRASLLIMTAALIAPLGVCADARGIYSLRNAERLGVAEVIEYCGRPANEFFFAYRPGVNRLHRRLDLVYDDWLYTVFEAVHLAQPRSIWLRTALSAGDITFVINNSDSAEISGLGNTLPQLGYAPDRRVGTSFYIWRRIRLDSWSHR